MIFTWGEGGFCNVFDNRPIKWPIATQKRKRKKPIKTFVLQDSSQLIELIDMNHNKYFNSC